MVPNAIRTEKANRNIIPEKSINDIKACFFVFWMDSQGWFKNFLGCITVINSEYPKTMLTGIITPINNHLSNPKSSKTINAT